MQGRNHHCVSCICCEREALPMACTLGATVSGWLRLTSSEEEPASPGDTPNASMRMRLVLIGARPGAGFRLRFGTAPHMQHVLLASSGDKWNDCGRDPDHATGKAEIAPGSGGPSSTGGRAGRRQFEDLSETTGYTAHPAAAGRQYSTGGRALWRPDSEQFGGTSMETKSFDGNLEQQTAHPAAAGRRSSTGGRVLWSPGPAAAPPRPPWRRPP